MNTTQDKTTKASAPETRKIEVYKSIASKMQAIWNCNKSGNTEWENRHADAIEEICKNEMPSGSGIDSGTKFDFERSTPDKLVFNVSYHHMNDGGYYDGWTEHNITVRPSLAFGFELSISGPNRNDIKEYLSQTYSLALEEKI